MDAGTYAWIVIISFFLVFTAVRVIHTLTVYGIQPSTYLHCFILSDANDRRDKTVFQY